MMEAVALAVFPVIVALGAGGVGVLAYLISKSHAAKTQLRFTESARALGLTPQSAHEASGARDGVLVRVVLATERRGSGKNRRTVRVTRYFAELDPPLRMGIAVGEQTAFFGELLDLAGLSGDITLGDDALDRALRIRALEPDHARAILREGAVRAPILSACAAGHFALTDARASLQHDGWSIDVHSISSRLEPLWAIAHGVAAARRRWRASWEPAVDASWGGLASTDGLAYDAMRSRLVGRVGDAMIEVAIGMERGTLVTYARATFPGPLGLGLSVQRTGFAHNVSKLLGSQDVVVGVPAFDTLFTVRAHDEEGARRALADGGGQAIVSLQSIASEVTADDTGVKVRVDGILHDARAVSTLVRALSDAVRAMRPGGPVSIGAFR